MSDVFTDKVLDRMLDTQSAFLQAMIALRQGHIGPARALLKEANVKLAALRVAVDDAVGPLNLPRRTG